jgi:hypothetical protein
VSLAWLTWFCGAGSICTRKVDYRTHVVWSDTCPGSHERDRVVLPLTRRINALAFCVCTGLGAAVLAIAGTAVSRGPSGISTA